MKNKKRKFNISKILKSNKFIFVLSLFIAIVIWIFMSIDASIGTTRVITDIPISISLSDEAQESGLRIFSGAEETASVTVSGNRVSLGAISKEDILVTAESANTINTAGTYTLSLTPTKANVADQFTITTQPSPSVITVYVDYYREKEFNIVDQIVYQVEDNYYASTTLSSKTVTVSGPQNEISKIASVSVSDRIQGILTSDVKTTLPIKLYDNSGYEISSNLLDLSINEVDASISVLPEKTVSLTPTLNHLPSGINISNYVTVDPSEILIAGPKVILDNITQVSLDSIDFSKINNSSQSVEANVMLPEDCRNLSNRNTAKVTLDFSSMSKKTVTVTNMTVEGLSSEYTSKVTTQSLDVTVIGPEDQLEGLDDSNIRAVIDTSTLGGTTGSTSMPVTITLTGKNSCWVYGEYKANIVISAKEQ